MKLVVSSIGSDRAAGEIDGWTLLGYDVCDESFLSGLMNCGYGPDERPRLAVRWGPRLNQWHLLEHFIDAGEFCSECDARVPEHAPFRTVAIFVRPLPDGS